MNHFIRLVMVLVCLCGILPQQASATDIQSPRTAALGGAGRAGPLLNDAIFLNPSFAAFLPTYSIGFNWLSYRGDQDYGRNYTLAVQDGKNPIFQAGFAFTQQENGQFFHLGAGKAVIEGYGVGLSAKMFQPRTPGSTTMRELTFSTTFLPLTWLQGAFVVDNLLETARSKELGFFREFVLGLKTNALGIFSLYFDPLLSPNRPGGSYGYSAGMELSLARDLYMRGGISRNTVLPFWRENRGRAVGFGFGWLAPRLSLDYGYQKLLESFTGLPQVTSHNFGATVYF